MTIVHDTFDITHMPPARKLRPPTEHEQMQAMEAIQRAQEGLTAAFDPAEARDDDGRWTTGGSGSSFPGTSFPPASYIADGKAAYVAEVGLPTPAIKAWASIKADASRGRRIADDYNALPISSPDAIPAYTALRGEVASQYAYLTHDLHVAVEVVDHDPYPTVKEMVTDLRDNHHLAVMSTEVTGGHPFLTNAENDQFRAVHDAFGHAAIGRAFDRNGEEAAFQSHAQMFTPLAMQALASETRGQNSSLVYGGKNEFPPQKVALLPLEDLEFLAKRIAEFTLRQTNADADNHYAFTRSHHTSLGRSLHERSTTASIYLTFEYIEEQHPRGEHGRWAKSDSEGRLFPVAAEPATTLVLTRDPTDNIELAPSKAVSDEAKDYAFAFGQNFSGYIYSESVDDYVRSQSNMIGWVPGSAPALTDAVSQWQGTYERARDITAAADALQGYDSPSLLPENSDMAYAKEILNAMAGEVPEGARSTNYAYDESESPGQVELQSFGDSELVRGVADSDGQLVDAFQKALDSDREVSWSVAAFAMPTAGDAALMGGSEGEYVSNEAIAIHHADDSGGSEVAQALNESNPVLISLKSAEGLNIDGAYEALVGGSFKVDSITIEKVWTGQINEDGQPLGPGSGAEVDSGPLSPEDLDYYHRNDVVGFSREVTRVTLTQTATPKAIL